MLKPEIIKICGLSTPETVEAAIAGGASHIGMIFFDKSPRNISLETARKLALHIGTRAKKVAVTVDASDQYLDDIVEASDPDMLQLHGRETPQRLVELKERYKLPVIKGFPIQHTEDLERAEIYLGTADLMLFDAKPPEGSELPGGNGVAFDWEIMDRWPQDVPYMLSGGLNAQNICEALTSSRATAVDISSGVETSPGMKNTDLIREFLAKVT